MSPDPGTTTVTNVDLNQNLAPVRAPAFLDQAGVKLTWGVLIALLLVTVTILGIMVWGVPRDEVSSAATKALVECLQRAPDKACTPEQLATLGRLTEGSTTAAFRDFWKSILDRVVGGIFLPVLTALLGYLFGSRNKDSGTAGS